MAVFSKYPWTRHGYEGPRLGYKLGTAHYDGEEFKYFTVHSSACDGTADIFGSACAPCSQLTENKGKIDILRKLANDPPGRLNFKYQTHDQLVSGSTAKSKLIDGHRLTVRKSNLMQSIIDHILYKGISTLLRTAAGMVVNSVVINSLFIKEFLVQLLEQTCASVQTLLNPSDPQDVTHAIEVIQALSNLRNLKSSDFNPSKFRTVRALQLIGTLFHAMTQPFVNPDLSLAQQMAYLSEYAHIAFMLYRQHGTSFMSNQLYGDSQVMVKNAYFYLAKQILMNPSLPVLLMLSGNDRLENLFGRVCMQGAHNSGVDIKTLLERLANAMDLC